MKIKIPFFKRKKNKMSDNIIENLIKYEENIANNDFDIKLVENLTELYSV